MRIDFEKIQTAANQVGVVIIGGGLVQGFFGVHCRTGRLETKMVEFKDEVPIKYR